MKRKANKEKMKIYTIVELLRLNLMLLTEVGHLKRTLRYIMDEILYFHYMYINF